MIPAPIQACADLTLIAAMGVVASFGLGLIALGIRQIVDARRGRKRGHQPPTITV